MMKNWWIILVLVAQLMAAQNTHLPLKADWKFRQKNKEVYYPATVPGTIHTDLLKNGLIQDPFYGTNESDVQWVEQEDWEYTATFDADKELLNSQHIELTFDGLDTYASVFLNERLILKANNMFRY
jgi:beta-mannosidase